MFYAIGNIGSSKKTDYTRLTDMDDIYEHCIEIMDVELPLSDFPKDTMINAMGHEEDETSGEITYTWAKDENLGILYELIDGEYVLTTDETVDLNKTYYIDILLHDDFSEDYTYGWRYISDDEDDDIINVCRNAWIQAYRFVTNSTDEEFKSCFEEYFVKDSALFYYLFTTRYTMCDNRAKNCFFHLGKTGVYRKLTKPTSELLPLYCELVDDVYVATKDLEINPSKTYYTQYAYDMTWGYDMDTSLGLNNYGLLSYRYGLEDTDVDEQGKEVFRESDSTFFCRIRDLFANDLKTMYNALESQNAWHSENFLNEIEEWQNEFPEELWRLDCERKYIRSYSESFINGAGDPQYLKNMANGKMKYAIKEWERSQEKYMASKYQSSLATSDNITIRCTTPRGELIVPVDYKAKLTPYNYMYLNVKYGTGSPIQVKADPGKEYIIPFTGSSTDIVDIYSASCLQSVGDISTFYPTTVDTAKATRLKELHIGNSTEGYDNPYLTTMTLGANHLLEVLNIENISGLTQSLNLSALNNLRELYAHGTNTGGVTFANSGAIEIAELPAITSMTAKNLAYLTNLNITSLDKLTTLTIENCDTIDVKTMLETAQNVNRVRITDINWVLTDTYLLERIYNMSGLDKNGYNTERAVITGSVHVPVIKQQQLADYQEAWSDLEITYDTMIEQFVVAFVNADENHTVLEVQYVDKGEDAIDPLTREDNPLSPTLESTISHNYTCVGWDKSLTSVFGDRTITAVYTESLRKYKIKYVSKGTVMEGYPKEGFYGDNIVYDGKTPTYTGEESGYKYCLFNHWDKSGFLTGDFDENDVKIVNAIYDEFEYKDGAFDGKELSELSPVEIYAMNKLGLYKSVVTDMDDFSFNFGYDYNYDDVDSEVIISEKKIFDGTNYLDTGIQLFDEDKDFVLAIDYKFTNGTDNSVLAQCYQGSGSVGFKLQYNNGVQLKWGANVSNITSVNNREMIVIRHKKGDTNLYIYNSKLFNSVSNDVEIVSLTSKEFKSASTLVFGCEKQTSTIFANYAQGEINWAKVWYADLGEDICKKLAVWTHEPVTLEACGFNRYYLSDNPDDMCSFSLLASHLLDRTVQWNKNGTNTGGWAESDLNEYLNNRLYEAMPTQIKSLLKQVKIGSSVGNKSSEVTFSDCYIAIPSVKEVNPSINKEPYNSEGTTIPFLNQAEISPKRAFLDGDYNAYWLRSPSADYTSYVWRVDADGDTEAITSATDKLGVVILLSF